MKTADELAEYTKLIKNNTAAQAKVSGALNAALAQLDDEKRKLNEERRKHEEFNNSGINRYWVLYKPLFSFLASLVVTLIILAIIAYLFVSNGYPINIRAGENHIESQPR